VYIWRTGELPGSISSVRKDHNQMWERIRGHNTVVTAAVFAPKPHLFTEEKGHSRVHSMHFHTVTLPSQSANAKSKDK